MKLGFSLTHHGRVGGDSRQARDSVIAQVMLAEEVGFESVFFGHHYLTRSAFLQPMTLASFLAARTDRIRLGLGVYLVSLHNPVAIAEELATLDVVADGRVVAGFGSGYRKREFRAFGLPFSQRYARLEESIEVVRALWSGEPVTMSGAFGQLEDQVLHLRPTQTGGPPIWLGAFGFEGIRRAARLGDAWLAPPGESPDQIGRSRELFDTERQTLGLPAASEYPILREGFVATSRRKAYDVARPGIIRQYEEYRSWDHRQDVDKLIRDHSLVGDPDDVVTRLRRLEELGFDHVIVRMQWTDTSVEQTMESIRLFGRHVIPAFN